MKTLPLILMTLASFTARSALAHTGLTETVPADRALIAAAPVDVRLTFSAPVRLTAFSIQKDDEKKQSLGPLPTETTAEFSVALPSTLVDGHYVVTWRAMSEDTHIMSGEFMFAVGSEGSHDMHMNHTETSGGEHHNDHGAAH